LVLTSTILLHYSLHCAEITADRLSCELLQALFVHVEMKIEF